LTAQRTNFERRFEKSSGATEEGINTRRLTSIVAILPLVPEMEEKEIGRRETMCFEVIVLLEARIKEAIAGGVFFTETVKMPQNLMQYERFNYTSNVE
jgi:hypothetical protein